MKIPALKIKNLEIAPPALLAPLAGYTHAPFRLLCREFNCGLTYTEMVMAEGIARKIPQSMYYLETTAGENPVAAHVYGTSPDVMARAVEVIEETGRFALIDLNCGCPIRKIIHKGAGVSLMKDPQALYAIVKAMVEATSLPVTIKTRIGISREAFNISEIAQAVEEAGASAITIHARFAEHRHGGDANWAALKKIKSERSIPVIGNGGIKCAEDASRMIEQTGVDAVMIGRRAIGNPWIFREIDALWRGEDCPPPSLQERRDMIERHLKALHAHILIENKYRRKRRHTSEQVACSKFRSQLVKYMSGLKGYRQLLLQLEEMDSISAVMKEVDRIIKRNESDEPREN